MTTMCIADRVLQIALCQWTFQRHLDLAMEIIHIGNHGTKVHSGSVDLQKNHRNYLITHSILKFPTPCRPSLQRRSFDMYISMVGPTNKKLAVLP